MSLKDPCWQTTYKTKQKNRRPKIIFSKGLLASMSHPNSLAFYFFHAGINKKSP
ncbi:MAG: hypothetical protein U9O20_01545 [Patescibacteria group bacterium]|nr:hypothetical protein [Patescibacteria group bacterium]